MNAQEMRSSVIAKYKEILGRNLYSQDRRSYCSKPYKDGKYYSDCSSSIADAYKRAGYPITYNGSSLPNTVGMYLSKDLVDVPVTIKNGVIQNPEVLRGGDILLFAGTDTSRAYAGYVGHVEMIYAINGSKITICGHGSGKPRTTELNAYCKSRFGSKTKTKVGNKGLIRVRRRIADDAASVTPSTAPKDERKEESDVRKIEVTGGTVNIRPSAGKNNDPVGTAKKGERYELVCEKNGFVPVIYKGELCWISKNYAKEI